MSDRLILVHKMELEKSHYEAVEKRRAEFETIRRDFNRKLETVAEFTRFGDGSAVHGKIAELAEKINATRENPYCAIPVINAVLTEKEKECAAAGIVLAVDLNLPNALAVEPMHLCSIFGNILDNAITACKKTHGADRPVIRLSSITDGDYLFIKAVNPSGEPKKAAPGRGYGMRILSDLTKRYGGDYKTEYKNGEFTILVSLLAANQAR